MEAMKAILSRRSIRQYTKQPVPDEVIEKLLQAGMSAPSAGNEHPWHFIIIDDRQILNEIPNCQPYSKMVPEAAVAILVCKDAQLEKEIVKGFWVQDCAAATENILIAANAIGLGAVWIGIHPREDWIANFRKLFSLPDHVTPFALISIGYPAEQKPPANRYDVSRIHRNRW